MEFGSSYNDISPMLTMIYDLIDNKVDIKIGIYI